MFCVVCGSVKMKKWEKREAESVCEKALNCAGCADVKGQKRRRKWKKRKRQRMEVELHHVAKMRKHASWLVVVWWCVPPKGQEETKKRDRWRMKAGQNVCGASCGYWQRRRKQ